jgi:hypothetical protein
MGQRQGFMRYKISSVLAALAGATALVALAGC